MLVQSSCWLCWGSGWKGCMFAFRALRRIDTFLKSGCPDSEFRPVTNQERNCLLFTLSFPHWWRRPWCVQEFVHAKAVALVCGTESIDWETLPLQSRLEASDHRDLRRGFGYALDGTCIPNWDQVKYLTMCFHLPNARSMFKCDQDGVDRTSSRHLFGLLYFFQDRKCSDPRDKIFDLITKNGPS